MSLSIFVPFKNPSQHETSHAVWPAGFEDYRWALWGHPHLKSLDIRLVCQIKDGLVVPERQYEELLKECELLEAKCDTALNSIESNDEILWWRTMSSHLNEYINNIREAIAFARSEGAEHIEID